MARRIKAKQFFDSTFKEFSLYDNVRSIPTLKDGLKPSQRKVIYGLQTRGENAGEIKLETLANYVSGQTDYHHGAASLIGTTVGLARTYPGTNNMNLLIPSGQFGSRLTNEAAAGRYIFTKFSENFRKFFKKEDDVILNHLLSDGQKIEPETYFPILPMALVNGSEGTGTGHSSFIYQYNPLHVRDACLAILTGKKLKLDTLVPWFNGYNGIVEKVEDTGQIVITGTLTIVNRTSIRVTELPIGMYVDDYKAVLNDLMEDGIIDTYDDDSNEAAFDFIIKCPRVTTDLPLDVLYRKFKLISRFTENYTLWNEKGILERFDTAEDIIERFVGWRVGIYEERRQKLISTTTESIRWANEKLRFILFYLANVDGFKNKKKDDLVALLIKNNFVDYDRLLGMSMWNLTRDRIKELEDEIAKSGKYLESLQKDTARAMYQRELKEFSV